MFTERRSYRLYIHYLLDHLKVMSRKISLNITSLILSLSFCWLDSHFTFFPHPPLPVIQLPELLVNVLPFFLANIFYAFSFTRTWWQQLVFFEFTFSSLSQYLPFVFLRSKKLNDTSFYTMEAHRGISACFVWTIWWRLLIWLKFRQVLVFYLNDFSFVTLT